MFKSTQNNFALSLLFAVVLSTSTSSVFGMGFVDRMKTVLPSAAERYTGKTASGFADTIVREAQRKFAVKRRMNGSTGVLGDLYDGAKEVAPALVLGALAYALLQIGAIDTVFAGADVAQAHMQDRGYNNGCNYRHAHSNLHGHRGLRYRF